MTGAALRYNVDILAVNTDKIVISVQQMLPTKLSKDMHAIFVRKITFKHRISPAGIPC